ncbi:peptidylprolyl isomerase/peptidyl-prolyl cis-trans isomerase D [Nonlabens dokdonensis]|jgi:peptidylprolyl isomerase/peptidyl-prolyl cis-trans isomerase D|uniref:Periplasmic chaperone PpiD n=2 Tax=Nonlabens dokdonensis TaxID=328515 RepID=L7WB52_NONDD|nr:peptidylprolyl isomerase [Nonlabens dokdonensis]AGC77121.1 putative peptidyl-prolyl cis-trans isomerase, PpiC-type [Nonlabens dokdonensis DSW-6]PZX41079.1 peptidylprolyl isomerase/peptidyl-prolyl cis-trans isomerase D [Nonlabens dokdonensis]
MAVLGKIRNQGVILILVIALALFAFIIQGVLTSNGQKQDDAVGYIGDTEIDRESFARKVENASQNRGANFSQIQAVNSVWDQEVRNAVLAQQIEAAGIKVTDEKVAELVKANYKSNPQFQNEDGSFNESQFKTFVANIKQSNGAAWNDFIAGTATNAQQEQFFNLLKSGLIATNADGEMEYRMENDNRSFSYVNIPYTTIADSLVEVTSSEISDYVSKHKEQFKVEAQRDIEFVLFEDKASQEDKDSYKADLSKLLSEQTLRNLNTKKDYTVPAITEAEDLNAYVAQNSDLPYDDRYVMVSNLPAAAKAATNVEKGNTYGPYEDGEYMKLSLVEDKKVINDSVNNRHILIAYQGAQRAEPTITRNKEAAKKTADSIFALIGQSKSKFDTKFEYFKENKEVANGQDIGWVVYSGNARNYAAGFTKFLYENEEGTVGIAESAFGYHIIRIDDVAAPKDAIKLATVAKKVIASKKTGKELFTKTVKFQKAAKDGDFVALAKENGVTSTPVNNLKPLDETLPTIGKNRRIIQWAFNEDRAVGDIERFETSQGYVIVKLNKKSAAGNMSSEEASAKVAPILRKEKKAKLIMDKINASEVSEIAKNQGQTMKSAANVNRKNPTIPGVGEEPLVVGTAFGLDQGATSKPIAGDNGVFVIKVTSIETAPDLQNYTSNANTIATQAANQSTSKLVEALKKSVEIEDNRAVFY